MAKPTIEEALEAAQSTLGACETFIEKRVNDDESYSLLQQILWADAMIQDYHATKEGE